MRDLPLQVASRKLAPWFVEPFEIEQIINPVAVQLRLPASLPLHCTFHVSRIKPVTELDLSADNPPARIIDGAATYTVWRILDICRCCRGWQYLVDWEGSGPKELM